MKNTTATIFLLAAFATLLTACGVPDTSQVSGQVTYNGQPVKAGLVSFEPVEGKSQPYGLPIKDGQYTTSSNTGMKPGKYIIRISAPNLALSNPSANVGPNDPVPPTIPLLPPTWNARSTLSVELKTGKNTANFSGEKMTPPRVEVGD